MLFRSKIRLCSKKRWHCDSHTYEAAKARDRGAPEVILSLPAAIFWAFVAMSVVYGILYLSDLFDRWDS